MSLAKLVRVEPVPASLAELPTVPIDVDEHAAAVTWWPNLVTPHGRGGTESYSQLFQTLETFGEGPFQGKDRHPGWSAARFLGNARAKDKVQVVGAIVLDYDGGTAFEDAVTQWSRFAGLVHTTKSHSEADPCFRVILPFYKTIGAEDYALVWACIDELTRGATDKATKDPSRFWFVPSLPENGGEFRAVRLAGSLALNAETLAAALRRGKAAAATMPSIPGGKRSAIERGASRKRKYATAALDEECNAVRAAPSGARNVQLNKSAFVVGTLVQPGWLTESEAQSRLFDAAKSCGLESHEIVATIASGLSKGLAKPRELPEPVERSEEGDADVSIVGFKCTDTGNAERLVARFGDRIRYSPQRKRWLFWDGRRWAWDQRGQIDQLAKRTVRGIYGEAERARDADARDAIAAHAVRSEKRERRAAIVALAQSEAGIPVLLAELDANPNVFNVANGTIDLTTGELRPHAREDLITKMSPVDYVAGAKHELWDNYLEIATGGDKQLQTYLQRMAGYAMWGKVSEKAFWFLYGPPDGMKSTFVDAISHMFGDYAVSADFATWLVQTTTGGNRGDLVGLQGARLVSSVEVKKVARFDEAVLKRVTGGDTIKASAKYESEVEFKATFALWLAANNAPAVHDDDEGLWGRMRRVPFTNPLPRSKQVLGMRDTLREQPDVQQAVLAWAVEGCLAWQREGFGVCAAVEKSTESYRAEMDRVAGFFDDQCVFEEHAEVKTKHLRIAYENWCRRNGVRAPLNDKELAGRLKAKGCVPDKVGRERGWHGVRLTYNPEPFNEMGKSEDGGRVERGADEFADG